MDKSYWDQYYQKNSKPFNPSDFANFVVKKVEKNSSIIDIGCGNGRDSIYLSKSNLKTLGVDQSKIVINNLKQFESNYLSFECSDIKELRKVKFDNAYCRFLFHSISEDEEDSLLLWLKNYISNKIFIEARIDLDIDQYIKTDHYRRLMNIQEFKLKLQSLGLEIEFEKISDKFSIYKKNYNVGDIKFNPQLIRLIIKNK